MRKFTLKLSVFLCACLFLMTSCTRTWTESDKKAYLDACTLGPQYKEYCACTLEKIMQKSPDPSNAAKVNINQVAQDCLSKLKLGY